MVETIKGGKSIYSSGANATNIGMGELPPLPPMKWAIAAEQPPARGVYAYAQLPGPCACAGCALGHLLAMGQRVP